MGDWEAATSRSTQWLTAAGGGLPVEDSWDFNKVDPLEDLRNDKDRLTLIAAPVPPVEVDVAVRATEWNGA